MNFGCLRWGVRREMGDVHQTPVLLYDGLCGFCDRTVQLVLRADRRGTIRFTPLQGKFAASVLERHALIQGVDSLVFIEPGEEEENLRLHVRSGAVLRIAWHLGSAWRVLVVFRLVPRAFRDWAYDVFARHRYRIFGRLDACPIPPPEVRSRFVD